MEKLLLRPAKALAHNIQNAFASAAALRGYECEMVVALPGWLESDDALAFPGESNVYSETILEQEDVFGKPVYRVTPTEILAVLVQHKERLAVVTERLSALAENLADELNTFQVMQSLFEREPSSEEEAQQIGRELLVKVLMEEGVIKP